VVYRVRKDGRLMGTKTLFSPLDGAYKMIGS